MVPVSMTSSDPRSGFQGRGIYEIKYVKNDKSYFSSFLTHMISIATSIGDASVRKWFLRNNFVIFHRRSKRIPFWNQ